MSLVRKRTTSLNRQPATASRHSLGNTSAAAATIMKKKTKPEWDATNSDLNQLKLSLDELERRKQAHQSKHAETVKTERMTKEAIKAKKGKSTDAKTQLALLKEILFDENQLRSLIMKSDSTLKTVQSIFQNDESDELDNASLNGSSGGGSKRQAKINVTLAPNVANLNESNLPHNSSSAFQSKKTPNQLVVANVRNLNNLSINDDAAAAKDLPQKDTEKELSKEQIEYFHNLLKYREVLENQKKLIEKKKLEQQLMQREASLHNQQMDIQTELANIKSLEEYYESEIRNQLALKDAKGGEDPLPPPCKNAALASLNDEFNTALNELEQQLKEFEEKMGRSSRAKMAPMSRVADKSSNTSSLTLTLIQAVSRIMAHLKETTLDLSCEKKKQEELNKQLDIHRKLIDGLTNELLSLKDQNEKIVHEFVNQQAKLEAEVDQMKILVRSSAQFQPLDAVNKSSSGHNKPSTESMSSHHHHLFGHSSSSSSNLVKSHSSMHSQSSSQIGGGRPTSCMSAINMPELNRNDRFSERLNAMLQTDLNISFNNSQSAAYPTTVFSKSASLEQFQQQPSMLAYSNRPSESGSHQSHKQQQIQDYREQINDLGAKNAQAQQRLRQVQLEHQVKAQKPGQDAVDVKSLEDNVNDAYEKLKQEKQLLKEQINLLNKQRETAKIELEVLAMSSAAGQNMAAKMPAPPGIKSVKNLIKNDQHSLTPSLSPIQPENIFQESELKGHYQLEVTPPRGDQSRY